MKALLLLLTAGKLGKVFVTGGTMVLSVFAYTLVFGWVYAVGLVALIFVHEMGHFLAARRRGLDVGAPTFIPFVGAWIALKDQPQHAETEAYIGFAGPFLGTVAALVCYASARIWDSSILLALSYSGFFLNLFNLIPLSPFDGGRITAIISPRIWFLGVPVLVALFFLRPSPMLILVAMLALPQLIAAWHYDPKAPENARYYGVSAEHKLQYTAYYLMLLGFLAVMSHEVHETLVAMRLQDM